MIRELFEVPKASSRLREAKEERSYPDGEFRARCQRA